MRLKLQYSEILSRVREQAARKEIKVVINEGGSRSTKTWSHLIFLIILCYARTNRWSGYEWAYNPDVQLRITITRLKLTWLKGTVLHDFEEIVKRFNIPVYPEINKNRGDQRYYGDTLYECRQAHTTQSDWTPDITPALWLVIPEGDEWVPGAQYLMDDIVTYEGDEYKCIQAHVSQVGWEPPNVPALWQLVQEPSDEWQAGVWYDVGDVVLYDGTEYKCLQAHTALAGWEPPNVPALWGALL